jgi:cytochrome c-type biogenesis protein
MISTLTMVSYALGTTVIIFLASLFAGLAKQTRVLLQKSQWVMRIGAGILIVMGGYYLVNGIRWLILVL